MTNSIVIIGLSIILIPAIKAAGNLSVYNFTDYSHYSNGHNNASTQLNTSFLPLFINSDIINGSSSLPSIEPIMLDSHNHHHHSFHSYGDNESKPLLNVSSYLNGTLTNRPLDQHDFNVSSTVNEHRLWTSKRVKPREPAIDPSDSRTNSYDELKFDQNYFALLNAVNHRPVASTFDSSKIDKNIANNSNNDSINSTRSLFYYSPETYGKVSHKNHQNTAFSFNWPPAITQATGITSLSTPSSLNPVKSSSSYSSSSSPSLASSNPSPSPTLIYADKPSKFDSTLGIVNQSPIIKGFSETTLTSNRTKFKSDFKPGVIYPNNPSKSIAEKEHLSSGEDGKNSNGNYNGGYVSEMHGDEESAESIESNDGNPSLNTNDQNNFDSNAIQSGIVNNANNHGNANKYYETGPFMISKSRSKVSQGPVNTDKLVKPLRFQDHVMQPPLTPSIDYLEEDYEATEPYPDFKNFQPMVKASSTAPTATAKYAGPAPYRHPYYNSYYPTRFYGPPYDEDNSPSKSGNNVNSWSGLAGFLLGIIPLGILMASMVPAFVSVPVATAAAGVGRRRRRSLFPSNQILRYDPVHDILSQYEMRMLRDADCIKEILCKVAVQGKGQKIGKYFFEATLNMRFNKVYHELGIGQVMEAARKNRCEKVFQCKKI